MQKNAIEWNEVRDIRDFKHFKEATGNDYRIWRFKLVLWPSKRSSSAETIVLFELKSTLRNSFHLSESLRRPEDVKMLTMALFTEREYSWEYTKYSFSLFCTNNSILCAKQRDFILFWRPRRQLARRTSQSPYLEYTGPPRNGIRSDDIADERLSSSIPLALA